MLRNHAIVFTENDPVTQIPNSIHYHRKCYQRFTLKRDLANFNDGESTSTSRRSKRKTGTSSVLPKQCLFCKKRKTKKKKETESLKLYDRAEESIKFAAKRAGDYNVLSIPDLIAAEAYYHKSSYKQYLKVNYDKGIAEKDEYFDIEVASLNRLLKSVSNYLSLYQ